MLSNLFKRLGKRSDIEFELEVHKTLTYYKGVARRSEHLADLLQAEYLLKGVTFYKAVDNYLVSVYSTFSDVSYEVTRDINDWVSRNKTKNKYMRGSRGKRPNGEIYVPVYASNRDTLSVIGAVHIDCSSKKMSKRKLSRMVDDIIGVISEVFKVVLHEDDALRQVSRIEPGKREHTYAYSSVRLSELIREAASTKSEFSVALVKVPLFDYSDSSDVMESASHAVSRALSDNAWYVRYSTDTFLVCFEQYSSMSAVSAVHRIVSNIHDSVLNDDYTPMHLKPCAGIATYPSAGVLYTALIKDAMDSLNISERHNKFRPDEFNPGNITLSTGIEPIRYKTA